MTLHTEPNEVPPVSELRRKAINAGQQALRDWEGGYDDNVSEHVISDILEAAEPHMETEVRRKIAEESEAASTIKKAFETNPPSGWSVFGTHTEASLPLGEYLEFYGEAWTEDGLPLWERVVQESPAGRSGIYGETWTEDGLPLWILG